MSDNKKTSIEDWVLDQYRNLVGRVHPIQTAAWPVLSGHNQIIGTIGDHFVLILVHTGNRVMMSSTGLGIIDPTIAGAASITDNTRELIRTNLARHFRLAPSDGIVFVEQTPADGGMANVQLANRELLQLLFKHELVMGLAPAKIFLSHKGMDKPLVRDFHQTLKILGFDPWLDEDAMTAGANRERAILDGFNQSCAAVFFITPNFTDENYLATEIEYAIDQKRNKGERFAIITLSLEEGGRNGVVPQLLKSRYIFKEPVTRLEALREILRALPLQGGPVGWKF